MGCFQIERESSVLLRPLTVNTAAATAASTDTTIMSVLSVGVLSRVTMPMAREDTSSVLVTGFKTEQSVMNSVAGGLPLWRETVPDILLLRHCAPRLGVRDAT